MKFRRISIRSVAFALLAFASARSADAAPVTIDFEALANLEVLTSQFAADQVVFGNLIVLESFSTLNEIDFPPSSGVHAVSGFAGGPVLVDFLQPASLFSVQLTTSDSALVQAFGAGDVLLDSQVVSANLGSHTQVAFLHGSSDIEYVAIASQLSGNAFFLTLDDVVFDTDGVVPIPEPSGLLMPVSGLALISLALRFRARLGFPPTSRAGPADRPRGP